MTIHTDTPAGDLTRLRIDRDNPPRRRWVPWAVLVVLALAGVAVYPSARTYVVERRAPEVEIAHVTRLAPAPGGGLAELPVLIATGYVVARHSSDVGVKVGGRIARLGFEEGTRVRKGQIMAEIEHADVSAQLEASRRAVTEAEAQLGQAIAARDEDTRNLERQRALAKDGITTTAALTGADSTAQVSVARVKSADAAIASALARVKVTEEALENTSVRAPFDGVVIRKRAEVGETVSPFGVQGQATREGGAIATIADLGELEVQTEVSENSVAKLTPGMPAEVKLQAYQDQAYRGRLRQIFPSADRAKSIVEVRVSILNADAHVKPEMTASVTFQEPHAPLEEKTTKTTKTAKTTNTTKTSKTSNATTMATAPQETEAQSPAVAPRPIVLIPRRAVSEAGGQMAVWIVSGGTATRRQVVLGAERIDQVEVKSGVVPGEAIILNPPPGLADHAVVRVKGS